MTSGQREAQKKYRAEHAEEIKAYNAAYRQTHKDEIKASVRAWREAHREEVLAFRRRYYDLNSDKILAQNKASRNRKKLKQAKHANKKRVASMSQRQRREVCELLNRGKLPADIAVWLHIPMSAILAIQQELNNASPA